MGLDPETYYEQIQYAEAYFPHDNPVVLRDFLASVSAGSVELAAVLGDQIDTVVTGPNDKRRAIVIAAAFHVAQTKPGLRRYYAEFFRRYGVERAAAFIAKFTSSRARKILFVAHVPYFQIVRESIALRRAGYETYLLYAEDSNLHLGDLHAKSFDAFAAVQKSLFSILGVIEACRPELLHLQVGMFELDFPLSRFLAEHKGQAACVAEFYDVLSLWCDYAELDSVFPELADYSFDTERAIVRDCDAISCRVHPDGIDELRAFHATDKEIVEFHPLPLSDFVSYADERHSQRDGRTRIVYAGRVVQLAPNGSFEWPRLRIGGYLLPTFKRITAQGIGVDIFMDPNFDIRQREGYELYQETELIDPLFRLQPGVPPDRFAAAINRYDFGLNMIAVDTAKLANKDSQFLCVGTKIFTYLEAGIPVIVNREWRYTAEIVGENGLGIVLASDEIDRLAEFIAAFDYDRAVENIRKFNRDHSLDDRIEKLCSLYERLVPQWAGDR